MKRLLYPTLFALIIVTVFAACRATRAPEFQYIENLRVENIGLNSSTLSVDLRYRNPNKSRMKLKNAEGDAWINNNYLGHFRIDTLVNIPADEEFSLPVKLKVDMDQVLSNSLALITNKEVPVKIQGNAKLGKGGVFVNYPIRYEGVQKVKKLVR